MSNIMQPYQDNLAAAARLAHVAPLGSLREKVDPNHAALIVIDMQNDFCARGGLVDKGGRDVSAVQDMARHLPALIESARKAGALVIFVRSVYTTDDNRYFRTSGSSRRRASRAAATRRRRSVATAHGKAITTATCGPCPATSW